MLTSVVLVPPLTYGTENDVMVLRVRGGARFRQGGANAPPPLNEAYDHAFDRPYDSVLENATFHAVIDFEL